MIRIGCSGWSYAHWRGILYPARGSTSDWLARYAAVFDTVEVNASFYRLPARETVERWTGQVHADFCFAVKASRYVTHVRRLREPAAGVRLLEERLAPLAQRSARGPVLWQLPPDFARDDARLRGLLEELPPGRHAMEFRHPSWLHDDVFALLRTWGVALVAAHRSPDPGAPRVNTTDWSYLRLHNGGGARGRYLPRELECIAEHIAAAEGDVYCYFNNDWEGFAVENARALSRVLHPAAGRSVH